MISYFVLLCTHVVCVCARVYTRITVSQHAFLHLKLGLSTAVQDLASFSCSPLGDPKWVQLQIHYQFTPLLFSTSTILSPATFNSCSYNRKSSLRCESTTGQPFSYAPTKYTRAPLFRNNCWKNSHPKYVDDSVHWTIKPMQNFLSEYLFVFTGTVTSSKPNQIRTLVRSFSAGSQTLPATNKKWGKMCRTLSPLALHRNSWKE